MQARTLRQWQAERDGFLRELVADLPRSDQRGWAETYVRGLLLEGQRKRIQPMAERLAEINQSERDDEQSLQQFVNQSPGPAKALRDRLQQWLAQRYGTGSAPQPYYLVMDDTGFPKQGAHFVGLARQYSGTLGKAANCQIAVTLQQGAHESVWGVAAELYLPKAWQDDPDRMTQAGVPDEIGYRPKWQMALQMLDRAQHNGLEALCSLTACTAVCMHSASNWMNGEGPLAWGSTAH